MPNSTANFSRYWKIALILSSTGSLHSLSFLLFVFQAAQKNYFCQDNNSFGENEAKVFCGMLGWPTGTTLATVSSWYTEKTLNRIENTFIRTLPG